MEEKNKHKKKKRQIADDPGPSEQMRDPFVHALWHSMKIKPWAEHLTADNAAVEGHVLPVLMKASEDTDFRSRARFTTLSR